MASQEHHANNLSPSTKKSLFVSGNISVYKVDSNHASKRTKRQRRRSSNTSGYLLHRSLIRQVLCSAVIAFILVGLSHHFQSPSPASLHRSLRLIEQHQSQEIEEYHPRRVVLLQEDQLRKQQLKRGTTMQLRGNPGNNDIDSSAAFDGGDGGDDVPKDGLGQSTLEMLREAGHQLHKRLPLLIGNVDFRDRSSPEAQSHHRKAN